MTSFRNPSARVRNRMTFSHFGFGGHECTSRNQPNRTNSENSDTFTPEGEAFFLARHHRAREVRSSLICSARARPRASYLLLVGRLFVYFLPSLQGVARCAVLIFTAFPSSSPLRYHRGGTDGGTNEPQRSPRMTDSIYPPTFSASASQIVVLDDARRSLSSAAASLRLIATSGQDDSLVVIAAELHDSIASHVDRLAELSQRCRVSRSNEPRCERTGVPAQFCTCSGPHEGRA